MPNLGDYLGQLMSELSMARMQADLETVRLAEFYASHPILRTMPVPHVRLPEVVLDVPVLMQTSEEIDAATPARGGAALTDMRRKFDEMLPGHLSKAGVTLSRTDQANLRKALDASIKSADLPSMVSGDVRRVSTDLSDTVARFVSELKPTARSPKRLMRDADVQGLKESSQNEFLKLRTAPPRLGVQVTSAEIRELGNPENVTRLKLKITDESFEWTSIEADGETHERLVPE